LRGRQWENPQTKEIKYFNSIQGWRIEEISEEISKEMPPMPPPTSFETNDEEDNEVEDDLPF